MRQLRPNEINKPLEDQLGLKNVFVCSSTNASFLQNSEPQMGIELSTLCTLVTRSDQWAYQEAEATMSSGW